MSVIGIEQNRRLTEWFINDDPTPITLKTKVRQRSGGSSDFVNGPDRDEQILKVIYSGSDGQFVTADGETRRFDFIIVGKYDAIIEINDYWTEGKQRYTIDYVYPYNGYEVKCGGTSHGVKPDHG